MTLFAGSENPLRSGRLQGYRPRAPAAANRRGTLRPGRLQVYRVDAPAAANWRVTVDLGVVARTYTLDAFDGARWVSAEDAGLGERRHPGPEAHLYAEVPHHPDATLRVEEASSGCAYLFDLGRAEPGKPLAARA